ncbi:hypothetical protein DCC35_20215 [Mangrovivirga cuniculi]|uniref:Uncharacterized protein n=1 Tax=Mangrovivirga cuniculi TaxID=2715131 RepID=A0A4D7JMR0_9BACT|nr:hypothetical protein DCC35_20215 [Mangrovivirga cuniculi]
MITFRIIIILTCIYALYNFFRVNDILSKVILGLQVLFVGLLSFEDETIKTVSFILFNISLLLILVYAFTREHFNPWKKWIMVSLAGILLLGNFFKYLQFPYVELVSKLAVLPIVGVAYLSYKYPTRMKNEFGFLVITAAFALINILRIS